MGCYFWKGLKWDRMQVKVIVCFCLSLNKKNIYINFFYLRGDRMHKRAGHAIYAIRGVWF